MSIMSSLRNIIFLEMRNSDPKLKAAIGKSLNAIDSDMEIEGYVPSSDVEQALEELDKVILYLDQDIPIEVDEPVSFNISNRPQPEEGYTDKSESDT